MRKNIKKVDNLVNAKFVDMYGIYLPNHANLSLKDIDHISNKFLQVAKPIFFKNWNVKQ